MSRGLKFLGTVGLLVILLVSTAIAVAAGEDTHVYGLVFIDSNRNGVWDVGEQGYQNATLTFFAGDEEETITLTSASAREPEEDEVDLCHYQDYLTEDGGDEDEDMDVNPSPLRPCSGTFGLRPAGESETLWRVTLTIPAGYVATTPNPVYYEVGKDEGPVEFGIVPEGAGGPPAGGVVLLPETGDMSWLDVTAVMCLILGSAGLASGVHLKKRQR